MQTLIDIGANLTHDSFNPDRDEVIARALAAGVTHMIVTGSDVEQSRAALQLAQQRPDCLSATAGIHPHHASEMDGDSVAKLRDLTRHRQVVAVGECGLDYFRNYSTQAQQQAAFEAQLELAAEVQLPVFLHQRDAHDDFVAILKPWRDQLKRAVAHCFTGTGEELRAYLDLDLYIGITGWICDERRGLHLRELISEIPADRLMIETDAPYLLPRDLKPKPSGRRNEPAYLPHVLAAVASAKGAEADQVAADTSKTAREFFELREAPGADSQRSA